METDGSNLTGLLRTPGFFENEIAVADLKDLSSNLERQKTRILKLLDGKEGLSQVEICGPGAENDEKTKEIEFWNGLLGREDSTVSHPEGVVGSEQIDVTPALNEGYEVRITRTPGGDHKPISMTLAKVGASYATRP